MNIAIINGPNLNLLGIRESAIYGEKSFEDYLVDLKNRFPKVIFSYFQSNVEGEIINYLHQTGFEYDGIILNAGAYAHTSVAIADAVRAIKTPVIEVHISITSARGRFTHYSHILQYCKGIITGFGLDSYRLATVAFMD